MYPAPSSLVRSGRGGTKEATRSQPATTGHLAILEPRATWLAHHRSLKPKLPSGPSASNPSQLVVTADHQCAIQQNETRRGTSSPHGPLGYLQRVVAAQSRKQRSGTAPPSWRSDCGQYLIVNTISIVMSNIFPEKFLSNGGDCPRWLSRASSVDPAQSAKLLINSWEFSLGDLSLGYSSASKVRDLCHA